MADHYQGQPFPTDAEHDRGAVRDESSLLAKLAQLTGQSDPFGTAAKTPLPLQSRANVRPQYVPLDAEASALVGSPPWMHRQKNEADVQASYRALQNKFPAALGSRPPVIKRADLGAKGVYYRTMVGPFGSTEEAAQFCGNLKSVGGQCVIQKMAKSSE